MSGTEIPLTDLGEGGSEGHIGNVRVDINDAEGTGVQPSSVMHVEEQDLMNRLPSRQLAEAARHIMAANTWKKKSKKRRPGYYTVRHHGVHSQDEVHQLASGLMGDDDFLDAPEQLQNDEIRELRTNMHNKSSERGS